jgi:hypothetical protein
MADSFANSEAEFNCIQCGNGRVISVPVKVDVVYFETGFRV